MDLEFSCNEMITLNIKHDNSKFICNVLILLFTECRFNASLLFGPEYDSTALPSVPVKVKVWPLNTIYKFSSTNVDLRL